MIALLFISLHAAAGFAQVQISPDKNFADGEIIAMLHSNNDAHRFIASLQTINGKATQLGNAELLFGRAKSQVGQRCQ